MSDPAVTHTAPQPGLTGFVSDWSSDKTAFKTASWGKAMIWIFLAMNCRPATATRRVRRL